MSLRHEENRPQGHVGMIIVYKIYFVDKSVTTQILAA